MTTALSFSTDQGRTWQTLPTIGPVKFSELSSRRPRGRQRKRAQQVRRSLR